VNPKVQIRALRFNDRDQWYELWREYLRFYRQRLPEEITEASFRRLAGDDPQLHGLVAELEGRLAGFVNYLFHPSSWSLTQVCYLEDLFVDPTMRGGGIGRALIKAVYDAADAADATTVYWMTQEFNAAGRALYDTLAHRTSFIRYER
jgi:GNAT superfamily N-acetyltransferase